MLPFPRPSLARRVLLGAGLLGVLADPIFRNGYWGIGLLAWMAVLGILVVVLVRHAGRPLSGESGAWLAVALLFAASLSWRNSGLLLGFNFLALLAALVLLAMSLNGMPVRGLSLARIRDLLRAGFGTGLGVATGAVPLLLRDAELQPPPGATAGLKPLARALVIALPVVLVFTLLLAQADPVFGSIFSFIDLDLELLLSHVLVAGFFAWVVAGWLRRALLQQLSAGSTRADPLPFALGYTDVTLALGALNLVFAVFVVVQLGWLFGGEALVQRTTGLGYAEYARRGFFELMWVAGLLLPVLLGAWALIPESDTRTRRMHRRLAFSLVLLLGAIMVSAFARMKLYVHYYGISADRLYATAVMSWLAIVFVWLALTVLRARPRTFAAGLVVSGFAVLLGLNLLNPDALVARANLARGDAAGTDVAGADPKYLATLGGDAVPALVAALIGPNTAAMDPAGRCASAQLLLDRWTGENRAQMTRSWAQWNAGRFAALQAVGEREEQLRRIACPDATPKTTTA